MAIFSFSQTKSGGKDLISSHSIVEVKYDKKIINHDDIIIIIHYSTPLQQQRRGVLIHEAKTSLYDSFCRQKQESDSDVDPRETKSIIDIPFCSVFPQNNLQSEI